MRGKKPLPTDLKIVKGTDRPDRINKNEPKPAADNIKPPRGLSAEARKQWRVISKQLIDAGMITNIDVSALAMYCETYVIWRKEIDYIHEHGTMLGDKRSPRLINAEHAFDKLKAMLVEFGMTPSSRTRVSSSVEKDSENPFAKFK